MKTTPKDSNERVSYLLKSLNLSETEASNRINKQPATIYRIVKKEVVPSKTTLRLIADAFNVNYEWLQNGEGEMLAEIKSVPISSERSLFDKIFSKLEEQLDKKDKQIDMLTTLLLRLGGPGTTPAAKSFQKLNNNTALIKSLVPEALRLTGS